MGPLIDSSRMVVLMKDCLYKEEEIEGDRPKEGEPVLVEGIMTNVGFHPGRLESHRAEVQEMLSNLPKGFHKDTGEGLSFVNACFDRNGTQWTSRHRDMDELFMLGMGLKLVECQLPRELWSMLPIGMPYYVINLPKEGESNATPRIVSTTH